MSDVKQGVSVAEVHFRDTIFFSNSAVSYGGALGVQGLEAFAYAKNVTFKGNSAQTGGAVFADYAGNVLFTAVSFQRNRLIIRALYQKQFIMLELRSKVELSV